MSLDIGAVRAQFPSLATRDNGTRRIYLDNPAGTGSGLELKGGLFPVKAVSYDAQAAIKLYIKDDAAEGGFRALANGDYVEPFEQTIGITVSPRQDGEKVYVSNGATYTEEAFIKGLFVVGSGS